MTARETAMPRVGFLGAGRMATALARGLIQAGVPADRILASDVSDPARQAFAEQTGGRTADANPQVVSESDVVVLAVKPQQVADVLGDIAAHVTAAHLVISIAAGVRLDALSRALGASCRIVRVMPNTPCLVGAGACAYAPGAEATAADCEIVEQLLHTVGRVCRVPEKQLDAVTGLSGSGPAFVYQFIEALSDGGVRVGLPRDVATQLAAQTVLGAARMVLETREHPGQLKDAVTSPGGTTIAGLHALECGGLRGLVMDAVEAATRRSEELGT